MITFLQILSFLYACTGIVATIGYFPTIKDLLFKKKSANINSYLIWTACGLVVFLYALFVIKDLLLEVVTGLNFACCFIILVLTLTLRNSK